MRKLASIQKILSLEPLQGYDRVEYATILGWHVVVKKGEFRVGDFCIYCEVDSIMPDREDFAFLRPRGMRIKTQKLCKVLSQGIAFPLSVLPVPVTNPGFDCFVPEEGMDVTDLLGVTKYEPCEFRGGGAWWKGLKQRSTFPSFLHKTDETRIQAMPWLLAILRERQTPLYISEKVDGSSMTVYRRSGGEGGSVFGVCSRNMDLTETEGNAFWLVARKLGLEEILNSEDRDYAVQGELLGPGIQGNKYELKEYTFRCFNVIDIDGAPDGGRYLNFEEFIAFCGKHNIPTVPILNADFVVTESVTVDSLVKQSTGFSRENPKTLREGLVIRPKIEEFHPKVGRVSFKAVSPEFLLKNDE